MSLSRYMTAMKRMKEAKILKSVADFLRFIDEIRDGWSSQRRDPLASGDELWFRGENSAYEAPLHPQIYRVASGKPVIGLVIPEPVVMLVFGQN